MTATAIMSITMAIRTVMGTITGIRTIKGIGMTTITVTSPMITGKRRQPSAFPQCVPNGRIHHGCP